MSPRFHGKHSGVVKDNRDPLGLGRVRVQVPELLGDEPTGWCVPSSPYVGEKAGFHAVPPEGSLVHVEWPAGDVAKVPIWSGGAWSSGDGVEGADPDKVLLVTPGGHRIALSDAKGKQTLEIEAASKARIALSDEGVKVEFGGQSMVIKRDSISLNGGALEVR